jgi:hypothetical protein
MNFGVGRVYFRNKKEIPHSPIAKGKDHVEEV